MGRDKSQQAVDRPNPVNDPPNQIIASKIQFFSLSEIHVSQTWFSLKEIRAMGGFIYYLSRFTRSRVGGTTVNVPDLREAALLVIRSSDHMSLRRCGCLTVTYKQGMISASPSSNESLLVHDDIKPCMFLIDAETLRVTIIDFGSISVLPRSFVSFSLHATGDNFYYRRQRVFGLETVLSL